MTIAGTGAPSGSSRTLVMGRTFWLRCEIPDGPHQRRRLFEALEVARGLGAEDGHASIEIAAGRVFCDLYYSGPHTAPYLLTALHLATGERFRHERTFALVLRARSPRRP
jgi:hypothetical protein